MNPTSGAAIGAQDATLALPRGIIPSMNTPFLEDGSMDVEDIRRSVDAVVAAGVNGMLLLAVAGETASLSMAEKCMAARAFVDHVAGRVPVIVGCSSAQQTERLELAALGRELGADAMLCQVPAGASGQDLVDQMRELVQVGPGRLMLQDLDLAGPGLGLDDILLLRTQLPEFAALKIEVQLPGPKYSAVLQATGGQLHVSGGWAAAQMMEALHRGVHAFIPTAMDAIYVEIHRRFAAGDAQGARLLHESLAPVLAFSNQHIDVSIRFFKRLRQREGIFKTAVCRPPVRVLDADHQRELDVQVERVLRLQAELANAAASLSRFSAPTARA